VDLLYEQAIVGEGGSSCGLDFEPMTFGVFVSCSRIICGLMIGGIKPFGSGLVLFESPSSLGEYGHITGRQFVYVY